MQLALTFFTQISLAHTDGLLLMLESQNVIPALVACLTSQSARLWEDDMKLRLSAPEDIEM
jgi:hypothetical protein